jgi:outer membrane receptor protein involved in Fe transport
LKDASSFEEADAPAEYLAGNYKAKETITAGYLQLNQEFSDKLTMVAGIRLENTSLIYENNTFTYTQEDIITSPSNQGRLSPLIQDFRAVLRTKLGGLKDQNGRTSEQSGATSKSGRSRLHAETIRSTSSLMIFSCRISG